MTRRNLIATAVAACVLAAAGCGPAKFDATRSFSLSGEQPAQANEVPPQSAAQTVKVEVTSDNAVDVYVLVGTTAADAVNLEEKDVKAKAAASKTNTKGDTLTVQVPAGQGVTVWVGRSGTVQKASGTVKMTN